MKDEKKAIFPKDFFTKERPIVTNKQALQDVIKVNWDKEIKKDKIKKTL